MPAFGLRLTPAFDACVLIVQHWLAVEGASWKEPEGPGSSVKDKYVHIRSGQGLE
jgi:hypothetical protein